MAFDPLSYENLGESIIRALEDVKPVALDDLVPFDGAGIYALYYQGDFPAYERLAQRNKESAGDWALYIGKAEAENARKGETNQASMAVGNKLFNRVMNHRKSIAAANNLDTADFMVRTLAVAPTWIPLAEVVAIRMHKPVWNRVIDGLGNHDPGAGRRKGMRSRWDTLHPGREWADLLASRPEGSGDLVQEVREYLNRQALG